MRVVILWQDSKYNCTLIHLSLKLDGRVVERGVVQLARSFKNKTKKTTKALIKELMLKTEPEECLSKNPAGSRHMAGGVSG